MRRLSINTNNTQPSTFKVQRPRVSESDAHWRFDVGRWILDVLFSRLVFITLAALVGLVNSSKAGTNDFFARGVELSQAGQFPEAADAFQSAAHARPAAGTLVNLGLAEWQRGRAGAAILANFSSEQAQWN